MTVRPFEMDDATLKAVVKSVTNSLVIRDAGMIDGVAELADTDVMLKLQTALWYVVNHETPVSFENHDDPHEDLEDHELQDLASAIYTAAAGRDDPMWLVTALSGVGSDTAEALVLWLEDWIHRYKPST